MSHARAERRGRSTIKGCSRFGGDLRFHAIQEDAAMETVGYNVNGASVYRKLGGALKAEELLAIICSLCGLILREAMQVTQCGHRFCKNCIEKIMSEA